MNWGVALLHDFALAVDFARIEYIAEGFAALANSYLRHVTSLRKKFPPDLEGFLFIVDPNATMRAQRWSLLNDCYVVLRRFGD